MKVAAIILAGGTGSRMKGYGKPKQFLPLGKRSILGHSLHAFKSYKKVSRAIITLPKDNWDEGQQLVIEEGFQDFVSFTEGGSTRQESVWKALSWLSQNEAPDMVLIHDAARPFITREMIEKSILIATEHGSVEVAVPTIDTIVESDGQNVLRVPDRRKLFSVQTPQTFLFPLILEAHQKAIESKIQNASDDVQLIMRLGHPVKIILGSYDNFKITTPRDYEYAKTILA